MKLTDLKKQSLVLVFIFQLINSGISQTDDLETLLFELPDVSFKKIETANAYGSAYELKIKQPLDHGDPEQGFFHQKVFLTHAGYDRPTVMVTEGYSRNNNRVYELTEFINANQIGVEHRFFGESLPDPLNYDYLNLEQATADLHHIRELFRNIYSGKWVSTGISKGGATTIFYRYYYPEDVDVSVPYVAPINNAFEDQRLYDFLDTIGSDDCREKIRSFQLQLLENREKVLPLLKFYSLGANADYTYLTIEEAFEYAVLEYPFSFWQYGYSCDEIPNGSTSIEEIVEYLNEVSNITFFSDGLIDTYGAHYYQAATEMGYYGYETKDFEDLLIALPTDINPHATFLPNKMTAAFDGKVLKGVNEWIEKEDNKFIYINGGIDTWSATAVPQSDKDNSKWFFMAGKHHGNARITEMTKSEKELLISTLEKWLSIKIETEMPVKK